MSKAGDSARIVFLGTGTSEGVPRVSCLTNPESTCVVCSDAMRPGSPNRRRNTSLLVQRTDTVGNRTNLVIDAGKFFYDSALHWFPKYDVQTIDALVITHAHQDAVGGFDDLRDWTNNSQSTLPIFIRQQDFDVVKLLFYYLVDRNKQTGGGGVAKIDFEMINHRPFNAAGFELVPLEVEHGEGRSANGYRVGPVSYISDTSKIPDPTKELISGSQILILDALRPERTHGTHLTLEEAVETARELGVKRTLLTDATHDIDHEPVNAQLAKLRDAYGLDIQYAYDGQSIDIDL